MKILWRLKGYGLRYKWRLAAAYVCTAVTLAGALVIPRLLGTAVDEVLTGSLRSQQLLLAAHLRSQPPAT